MWRHVINLSGQRLVQAFNGATQMWNRDRASNHERDIERIEKLRPRYARADALFDVISDAIITAKHCGSDQAQKFLCAFVECAIFVSLRVEREESLDAEVIAAEQFFIHVCPVAVEFVH